GQRCGTNVTLAPDFPEYAYAACHTAPAEYHPSSGKSGTRDCRGGWHDAGDYGKYVVNSGITTGTLLWAFELNASKLAKKNLAIPESGDKVPDMLNEIRWNLDWMLKMQDEDGGAWHKETTANFPGFIMPKDDKGPTLIIGTGEEPFKNTTATADLAAVAAIAARVFRPYDRAYAAKCLAAAEKAWAWLQTHPDNTFQNPRGVNTGGYGDRDPSDERLWAAAELFRTTGKKPYDAYFLAHQAKWSVKGDAAQGWPVVNNMAKYAYALGKAGDRKVKDQIKAESVQAAREIVERIGKNGYRVPMLSKDYIWGSNAVLANYGMMLLVANRFQKDESFRNGALDCLHYLFGRNTFNTSYVTHVGTKWAMNPHHRPSGADGMEQPWPGLLMGGPNASGKTPPARQWEDKLASFTTNEIAINWQAPLVFLLSEFTP
ncbi:MAG TPA: glycoside hydrolase family 9 protein, partial [Fimbriimonas sp.]